MTEKQKNKRGGARPGSGRPKTYQTGRARSISLHVYLSEEEGRKLDDALRKTGEKKTTFVRAAIREHIANKRKWNGLPPE